MRTLMAMLGLAVGGCGSMPAGFDVDASGDVVVAPDGGDAATDSAPADVSPDGPVCPSGRTFCAPGCVDLRSDPGSCGTCYHACASGQTCTGGMCVGGGDAGHDSSLDSGPACDADSGVHSPLDFGYPDIPTNGHGTFSVVRGDAGTQQLVYAVGPFSCSAVNPGMMLNFSLQVCTGSDMSTCYSLSGTVGSATDASVSVTTMRLYDPVSATFVPLTIAAIDSTGPLVGRDGHQRENIHIQFSRTGTSGSIEVGGIDGMTVSPCLGDLWYYGCLVN